MKHNYENAERFTSHRIVMRFIFLMIPVLLFVAACNKNHGGQNVEGDIVYLESNGYGDNENSILAYYDDGTGQLKPLLGSPFKTGGAGLGNPQQILGPDDQETPLVFSNDKKYLFAVNPGSNTIAAFKIDVHGRLQAVNGSPFASGGQTPQSLSVAGNYLYVANKSQDPLHNITTLPNYSVFKIGGNGSLTPLPGGIIETTEGVSPAQVLVSKTRKFAFASDFLGFMAKTPVGTLRSFTIGSNGILAPVPGTPYFIPGAGGALGLWEHPSADVLYVGFPLQAKVGVYNINASNGALSFQTAVDAGPAACWLRTNSSGKYLYSLNSGENTISVFNTSSAASPIAIQKFTQKQSGPLYGNGSGAMFTTSQPFGLGFSKSEKYLYVVNQHTSTDFSSNFNYLHVLKVAADGQLSEPTEPIQLPVNSKIRPQGIAVY
jgi:6-phosphogluconolactonase (cycloisomerase 2 family)